jgi:AAA+ superfamily predicted ATPase
MSLSGMNSVTNRENLQREINWLAECLIARQEHESSENEGKYLQIETIPMPELSDSDSEYAAFIKNNNLNFAERLILCLSLIPHTSPNLLNIFYTEGNPFKFIETKLKGMFIPTGETALYLLAGNDYNNRNIYTHLFEADHLFYRKGVLDFKNPDENSPTSTGVLAITKSYLDLFTFNKFRKPKFSPEFPAHLLTTKLKWDDLILNEGTQRKLVEVKAFIKYENMMRTDFAIDKHLKPGYRCLFYGPSGTGKSLAATLIGQELNRDVYRVDLSSVISKYIGETSKNLNNLFNLAEDKNWILFFDEGDALFARRADTSKSNNSPNAQHGNQDVAFLLQRIENYNGLVIVATNFKQNIDTAFLRRFQNTIHFTPPDEATGLKIWQQNLPEKLKLDPSIKLEEIVRQYNFTAASVINVIQRLVLIAVQKPEPYITKEEMFKTLEREKIS